MCKLLVKKAEEFSLRFANLAGKEISPYIPNDHFGEEKEMGREKGYSFLQLQKALVMLTW